MSLKSLEINKLPRSQNTLFPIILLTTQIEHVYYTQLGHLLGRGLGMRIINKKVPIYITNNF